MQDKANFPRGQERANGRKITCGPLGQLCGTRRARQKSGSAERTLDIGPKTRIETRRADSCHERQTKPIPPAWLKTGWRAHTGPRVSGPNSPTGLDAAARRDCGPVRNQVRSPLLKLSQNSVATCHCSRPPYGSRYCFPCLHRGRLCCAPRNDIQCSEIVSLVSGAAGDEAAVLSEKPIPPSDRQGLGDLKRQERRKWRFCAKNTDFHAGAASDRTHTLWRSDVLIQKRGGGCVPECRLPGDRRACWRGAPATGLLGEGPQSRRSRLGTRSALGVASPSGASPERPVLNQANPARGPEGASALQRNDYDMSGVQRPAVKQGQFPRLGHEAQRPDRLKSGTVSRPEPPGGPWEILIAGIDFGTTYSRYL
jgi:hypothetical protein